MGYGRVILAALVAAAFALFGGVSAEAGQPDEGPAARGEAKPPETGGGKAADKPSGTARRRAAPKAAPGVEELEALVIEGRIQKPEVFYVLGRAGYHYRGLPVRRSFVPRIVESLKRNPL